MLARMPRRSGVGTGSRGGLGSLVLACIAGLLLIWLAPSPNAAADDSVLPVIPSTAQVDAAKSAVATQGDRVAELDAAYQQARPRQGRASTLWRPPRLRMPPHRPPKTLRRTPPNWLRQRQIGPRRPPRRRAMRSAERPPRHTSRTGWINAGWVGIPLTLARGQLG